MADIADIGFRADTSQLKDAKGALDALSPAASKAEKSSDRLGNTLAKVDATADKLAAAASGLSSAVAKMDAVLDRAGKTATTTAAANGMLATSGAKVSVTYSGMTTAITGTASATSAMIGAANGATSALNSEGAAAAATGAQLEQLDAHVAAYRANLRQLKIDQMAAGQGTQQFDGHVVAFRNHMDAVEDSSKKASKAIIKFSGQDSLNAMRQLSDIGVTAAMGMSPFMIAIQQGPQLLDILQNKAAMTGQTLGAVFKAAGATIWTALAPLLPLIIGIAAVVGTIAAAFALGTREINKSNQSVIDGMGLTEKQLERVKKKGIDTGVTIGDTFFAFFSVIGDRLTGAFDGPLKWLKDAWNTTLDFITKYGAKAIEFIVGGFTGAVYAIKAGWSILPAALGEITINAANATIAGIEWMINKAVDGLNGLIGFANSAAEKMGLPGFGTLEHSTLGRQTNPYAGQTKALASAVSDGMAQGLNESKGMMSRFWSDVDKKARQNARDRIKAAAGDPAKTPKGPKSDAAKFEDIVTGANADIAKENARAAAAGIDMTAEAAAKLEYQTKLLNEAQSKGIPITAERAAVIDQLAGAYAKAKVAADNAVGLQTVMKAADGDIASMKQQIAMVGLYGRELAYATEMAKLLNEARAKGMTPDAIAAARPKFQEKASQVADSSTTLEHNKFIADTIKKMDEETFALGRQRGELGLSGEALIAYQYQTDLLAQAKSKNITLTEAETAAIGQSAVIYAHTTESIRKTKEAIDFAKEGAKAFFTDTLGALRQGQSLWGAFADAALNALNKITDKLLDMALNGLFDMLFKSIGGAAGGLNTSGAGMSTGGFDFGAVSLNAKGNAFGRNGIVNKPTAFAFGKGGANLGIAGEAGDEAIMPLTRGPDGSLGVQMYDAPSRQGSVYAPTIDARATYTLSGAVSSGEVAQAIRQAGAETENRIKRGLPQLLNEYQRNGTTG